MCSTEISIGAFNINDQDEFKNKVDEIIDPLNLWQHRKIEDIGQRLIALDGRLETTAWWHFSKLVCSWGRGMRVWANFNRHYSEDKDIPNITIGNNLRDAFLTALSKDSVHDAMKFLIGKSSNELKGFRVSYLSKHLRMLAPDRFAVLDSVLTNKTGFAQNANGYMLFMDSLSSQLGDAQKLVDRKFHIADFEAAVFLMADGGAGENRVSYNHAQYLENACRAVQLL